MMVMVQSWWPLSPWLSPGAAWFIFFNAVVAAIAVMSSCTQQDRHVPTRRRLCRSASSMFLDQLRSFSIFSVHPTSGSVTGAPLDDRADVSGADYYCCSQEAEVVPAPQVTQACTVAPETPRQTAPEAGERVPIATRAVPPSAPAATAAADAASVPESNDEEADAEEEQDKSISVDEAYAIAQQRRANQPLSAPAAAAAASAASETNTAASSPQKKDLVTKSSTRKDSGARKRRARSGGRNAEEAKAELNARAELFIRQFREELKLQRLNSLLSHTYAFSPRGCALTAAY